MTAHVPLFVSLLAVMVAVPAAIAVTTPVDDTVATLALLELHVTGRSVTTVPSESFTVTERAKFCVTSIALLVGETVTLATGNPVTVTAVVPDFPSLVAVIVVLPCATPVTRPRSETVAIAGLLDDHATTRPVTMFPFTSRTVALIWTLVPITIDGPCGCTATEPTATFETMRSAVPLLPSLVAVTVALPWVTAVTIPWAETVATAELELDHTTVRPFSAFPAESASVAVSCVVCPTVMESGLGVTDTVDTAACDTVIVDTPLFPSDVAVIVAEPGPVAETSPFASTVATPPLLVLQMIARPGRRFCKASYAAAVNCVLTPGAASTCGGVTTTVETGVRETVMVARPDLPFALAATWVEPGATPVTIPAPVIVATLVSWLDQKTSASETVLPVASWTSA